MIGSIPARAGEPRRLAVAACRVRVYPRACGGTGYLTWDPASQAGLSPRVRGNLQPPLCQAIPQRSIPARAGEPPRTGRLTGQAGVYPRACGGTGRPPLKTWLNLGLSPRVRGNPLPPAGIPQSRRSIPARAGEPVSGGCWVSACQVYPRACGGTPPSQDCERLSKGLSPRVRGNLRPRLRGGQQGRSIPARAGEPSRSFTVRSKYPVYPRACGGTPDITFGVEDYEGLSPRVRGEPIASLAVRWVVKVYPRACGGTW